MTSAELLALLENPSRWPELAGQRHLDAFAHNLFIHWRILLGPGAASNLEALYDRGYAKGNPLQRSDLAWAVADAVPERRRAILKDGIALNGAYAWRLLERLAAEFPAEEARLLSRYFAAQGDDQVTILDGLARAKPPPRQLFRSLLRLLVRDEAVLGHAAETARALGCKLPEPACEAISASVGKGGLPIEEHSRELQRVEKARDRCLVELKRCSSRW